LQSGSPLGNGGKRHNDWSAFLRENPGRKA